MGDTANIRSWQNGEFFVGPVGTTMPTTLSESLDAGFKSLGILDEEAGAAWSVSETSNDYFGWGVGLTRTLYSKHKRSVKVVTQEDNPVVFLVENPGATSTTASGVTTSSVVTPQRQPYAVVATETDGPITRLRLIASAYLTVAPQGEDPTKIGMRDITIDIVPDSTKKLWTEITDDPAMAGLAKTVTSIAVTPSTKTLAAAATWQLAVVATYSDSSTATVTSSATYSTSSGTYATVSSGGLITAVATGSATITASFGGSTGTCAVTVS